MTVTLPDELVWVLDLLGFTWPMADEDKLQDAAKAWRQFADDADDVRREAAQIVRHVVGANEAEAIDAFAQYWKEFETGDDGHLADAADSARIVADVLEGFAAAVVTMKTLVLAQVVICAAQIAIAIATAAPTFGASLAVSTGVTQGIRLVVRRIIREGIDAIQRQFINKLKRELPELFRSMLKATSRKVDDAARRVNAVPAALTRGGRRPGGRAPGRHRPGGSQRRADEPGSNRPTSATNAARSPNGDAMSPDPVDLATGEVLVTQFDLQLGGALPLRLERTHKSSYRAGRLFGPSWASILDQRLELDDVGAVLVTADGRLLVYPTPEVGTDVLPEEGPRWPLRATDDGGYAVTDRDTGHTRWFDAVADPDVLPLTAVTDRNDNRIDLEYDDGGTLTEVRHSGGYRIGVETTDGLLTALRWSTGDADADPELVRFGYSDDRRLSRVINSSGIPLTFDYDPAGRMTRWEDRNGVWYRYHYDADGRCTRGAGSDGCLDATFDYDTAPRVTAMTNSLGQVSTYHFNERFQLVRHVDPLGNATLSEWDRFDRLLARTDALGRTTTYNYDDGNLVAVTRPDGSRAVADYNDLGLAVRVVDPGGAEWRREYDARGNLTLVVDPLGARTTYDYGERGHLSTVTNPVGSSWYVETDDAGLPLAITGPLGSTTAYERDSFGRVTAVRDPVGGATRLGWTVEGRAAWRTLPDGATERWSYDAEGNLVQHVDALGQASVIEFTNFDLPAAETGPDGARQGYSYDTELRLQAVTNPQGLVWRYEYDAGGRLVAETDFNGRRLTYAHDAAGQLLQRTNGVGQTTDYARDELGSVIEQRSDNSVTTFAYDAVGRLIRAASPDADLAFEHDAVGRVLAETCNGRTLASTYDAAGRRDLRRTPSGAESRWSYDAEDRPVTVETAGREVEFGYDVAGREIERLLDAMTLAQTWDANHQLSTQTVTATAFQPAGNTLVREERLVQQRSYGYRPDGYVTSIDDHLAGDRRFDLDPVGRVKGVHGNGWTERYAYDPAGNVTDADWPSPTGTELPDADARGDREYAGTLIRRAGNVRYENDAQGRVVLRQQKRLSAKPRTWRYTWDGDDRLVAATTPDGQQWRYRYDALGRRIAKERLAGDGVTVAERVDFTWDGVVLAEQTVTGDGVTPAAITVWEWEPGTFRPLTQAERTSAADAPQEWIDARFYAIVTDLVGTPTELVDPDGNLAWRPRCSLWGAPIEEDPSATHCPLRFPGQYSDGETGLHYNFFRYYEPGTGRYESSDPLGLAAGPSPHTYVPNPLNWLDGLGLKDDSCGAQAAKTRPADSPHYSVAYETRLDPSDYPGRSDKYHFSVSNRRLDEAFQGDAGFAGAMDSQFPGIVDFVRPGLRGGYARRSPAELGLTWHHQTTPGVMQLIPTAHHGAPGAVQASLHPGGVGGMALWGGGR